MEGGPLPLRRFVAIAVLQVTGCHEEATTEVDALLANRPDTSIQSAASLFASYKEPAQVEVILDALRNAGVPDEAGGEPNHAP